jgi:serine/threonine protein kinase
MTDVLALAPGTELVGDFRIDRVLGAGGFGITYLADEIALARSVTIKEYFPSDFAARAKDQGAVPRSSDCAGDYKWGLDRFIEEAQTLARFDHRNICRVYRYFRANNTGYMVLHFEEGSSLKGWLKGLGRAPRQAEIDNIVGPLLDALEVIHKADFLHRDIAPDNIMLRRDGSPVLIDFGSARGDIASHSRTVSALVKPGYSPYEQYAEKGSQQGPWTDIYAFAATIYHAITGQRPPDSPSRVVKDEYVPAKDAVSALYRPRFLAAIDRGMSLDIERRPKSIIEWRGDLLAPEPKVAKKGWLPDQDDKRNAKSKKVAAAAEALAPAGASELPPVPDAPGRMGSMLDYFEGLKKKTVPKPGASMVASLTVPPSPPPPAVLIEPLPPAVLKPVTPPTPRKAKAAKPAKRLLPLKPSPQPVLPLAGSEAARPPPVARAKPEFGQRAAVVLLVLAGISSAALGLKDHIASVFGNIAWREKAAVTSPPSVGRTALAALELRGNAGDTVGVGFSGDQVVAAGADGSLKLWSATSGVLQHTIFVPHGPITSFAVLARRAITGHGDGTTMLWDLDKGEILATFKRNEANVWAVAFAGAQDRIVTASHDWSIAIWEAATPAAPVQVLDGHESAVQAVAFSAAGPQIASGGADRSIRLWNMETASLLRTYRGHKDFVTAVDFSADGRLLASAGLDGSIHVWSTVSNRLVTMLTGHIGRVNALAFGPAGETLASVGEDGILRLWEPRKSKSARTFASAEKTSLRAVSFSGNGRRIAVAGVSGAVTVRDIEVQASAARDVKD